MRITAKPATPGGVANAQMVEDILQITTRTKA
jgi:hypothetical protein